MEPGRHKRGSESNDHYAGRIDINVLALGKKSGLSFAEMNELQMSDIIPLIKRINGTDDDGDEITTNQKDIDKFFA